jgi:hypothetical protein
MAIIKFYIKLTINAPERNERGSNPCIFVEPKSSPRVPISPNTTTEKPVLIMKIDSDEEHIPSK